MKLVEPLLSAGTHGRLDWSGFFLKLKRTRVVFTASVCTLCVDLF